jgi:hypothetical protein
VSLRLLLPAQMAAFLCVLYSLRSRHSLSFSVSVSVSLSLSQSVRLACLPSLTLTFSPFSSSFLVNTLDLLSCVACRLRARATLFILFRVHLYTFKYTLVFYVCRSQIQISGRIS